MYIHLNTTRQFFYFRNIFAKGVRKMKKLYLFVLISAIIGIHAKVDAQIITTTTSVPPPPPQCYAVISPTSANIYAWETVQFSATVHGECNAPCYAWEVMAMIGTGGTINVNGLYTAGSNPGADKVIVKDTCNENITDSAIVNILSTHTTTITITTTIPPTTTPSTTISPTTTVPPPCEVTAIPAAKSVFPGETIQFSTSNWGYCITPCYSWEVAGSSGSFINTNGFYTAGNIFAIDTVTVTDQCNDDASDTAIVKVAPCKVTINPSSASVDRWETIQFSAVVNAYAGETCNNPCYTWEVLGGTFGGTIDANGLYTPLYYGVEMVIVTDTCNEDISDTAIVTVKSPPDADYDGIPDTQDNCPNTPNGPHRGTCVSGSTGLFCMNTPNCGPGGFCSNNQEDTYPPGGNGIGDACDCEGDFNCDGAVDANDVASLVTDFGRGEHNNFCTNEETCNGDFNCDTNVDSADVTKFSEDFGRSPFFNPCPACVEGDWCVYP